MTDNVIGLDLEERHGESIEEVILEYTRDPRVYRNKMRNLVGVLFFSAAAWVLIGTLIWFAL